MMANYLSSRHAPPPSRQRDPGATKVNEQWDAVTVAEHEEIEPGTKQQVAIRRLSLAGVEVIRPWPISDVMVTPPAVAGSAGCCGQESGRQDRAVDYSDADRVEKGNTGWSELAHEFGLMSDDGTFLVSLATQPEPAKQWFEVRLHTGWDLVGVGAEQLVLGHGHGDPVFATHSIDGKVLIIADWYETFFSMIAIPNPQRSPVLRRIAGSLIDHHLEWPSEHRLAAQGWLNRTPGL